MDIDLRFHDRDSMVQLCHSETSEGWSIISNDGHSILLFENEIYDLLSSLFMEKDQ